MRYLPLQMHPWIQAYHLRNFELGVLQEKEPWILGKYINCFFDGTSEMMFSHCTPEGRYFINSGATLVQRFRLNKTVCNFAVWDFVGVAKELINNGWYIVAIVDEYHVPETGKYHKNHYSHSLMIFGYDDEKECFASIGYTAGQKYCSHELTYKEYEKAIRGILIDDSGNESIGFKKIEFEAFKENPQYDYIFDIKQFYHSLDDYIESYYSEGFNSRHKYGIECERVFSAYISSPQIRELDPRYSRFFMELKQLMVRRLSYLADENVISNSLAEEYAPVCRNQEIVHNLFIKYGVSHDEALRTRIGDLMNKIIEREVSVLMRVRKEISDYILKKDQERYL